MLKKIAILTAAAGMLSTSMAVLAEGPTVYGRVAFGFSSVSGETDADDSQKIDEAAGNRLGVSGSNDLGNGMSVDYLLEYGAGDSLKLRHANMTLNGSFGQFRLGQQTGVLYRYIGSNSDQSTGARYAGNEWYTIASENMNSDHSLRMSNIAAYRFGAGPGGDDPITFDIQIQGEDMSKGKVAAMSTYTQARMNVDSNGNPYNPDTGAKYTATEAPGSPEVDRWVPTAAKDAKDDDKTIDSVTIGAATSLGPVKLQLAYVDENGSAATDNRSPSLLSFGFRAPLGSAEIRGHMTSVDADMKNHDDDEAWGLLVMNDFGGGYFGMVGVGSYTNGGKGEFTRAKLGDGDGTEDEDDDLPAMYTPANGTHKNHGDMTNAYVSISKSFGGGLSVVAEYSTVTETTSKLTMGDATDDDVTGTLATENLAQVATGVDDDEKTTNKFQLYLIQSF